MTQMADNGRPPPRFEPAEFDP